MRALRFPLFLVLTVAAGPLPMIAQAPTARLSAPRIGYVYPAGGKQGTTFTVTVGGQFLSEVSAAEFFGPGVQATVVSRQQPLNQKQLQELRDEGERLMKTRRLALAAQAGGLGGAWTISNEKRLAEIRGQAGYRINRQAAPSISEAVTFQVTIAADAPLGEREVRLRAPLGLSNPLPFLVGLLPEYSETPAHPNTAPPAEPGPNAPMRRNKPASGSLQKVVLPAVVNGQILPGEVDRIHFNATKGQKLVVAASARSLIPYLADAVPGWFQATLALTDANGRELAYDDDFHFNPDPVLYFEIRQDGDYIVEIKDAIYRGRQDFVYRIAIGEVPFITSIFPLGGPAGQNTPVEMKGWNLPSSHAVINGGEQLPGRLAMSLLRDGLSSNPVAFALDDGADSTETESNDDPSKAQGLQLPAIVNGRIGHPGDRDCFSFEGRAGSEVVLEVVARRLNSPLDSLLQLLDAAGQLIASNDDAEDKGAGLTTHHADSRLLATLPGDGRYIVQLADTQHQGGPEFAYRLHVRTPSPDFELRVVPSSINIRTGTHVPVTVFALRKDGFAGPIEIGLRNAGRDFGLSGALIPAGQDKVRLTLTTVSEPRDGFPGVEFLGRSTIAGQTVVRTAVPCEDMMQAFAYRHLVPAKDLKVSVIRGAPGLRSVVRILGEAKLKFPAGGKVALRVAVPIGRMFDNLKAELSEPPEGIVLEETKSRGDTMELIFSADPEKAKPGSRGNLIVFLTGERAGGAKAKAKNRPRIPLTALPAISFEVATR